MKKRVLLLTALSILSLVGCNNQNRDDNKDDPIVTPDPGDDPTSTPTPDPQPDPINETVFDKENPGNNKEYPSELSSFTPSLFDKDSFKEENNISLGNGVNHKKYTFNLNNENKVEADVIEVDLTKATITSNYSSSGVATPYKQLEDYESSTNKKVMAIANGDFFATGYGPCVNAYVNDSNIIKEGHNDKGIYDYTNLDADIPASKPMLFGISGQEARIAPIVENENIETTIKSKFSYMFTYLDSKNSENSIVDGVGKNLSSFGSSYQYNIVDTNMSVTVPTSYLIYKFEKIELDNKLKAGKLISKSTQKLEGNKFFKDTNTYFYLNSDSDLSIEKDTKLLYSIHSDDNSWNYYSTIIGGRQSLVKNGEIASTVTSENSNGAQRSNIPRTAIGVKDKSTVFLVTIESLRYNSKLTVSDSDSYGVNLPELAEFMRYIGSYDALNLDGGGSTQLITKDNNGSGDASVIVRSSDYGTYNLADSRKVYNTVIVSTK